MQTPPRDLTDADVLELVREGWSATATRARYLPVGYGSHHWAVEGPRGERWFVSGDVVGADRPAAALEDAFGLAAAARRAGVTGAHGPVPTADGRLVAETGRWAVSVQPWLEGPAGRFPDRWSDTDALDLVALLAGLHGCPAPGLATERPGVVGRPRLERALDDVTAARPLGDGPLAPQVGALLHASLPALRRTLAELDSAPAPDPARFVPTHGEPHPGNVVATDGGPVLVDWDTARAAEPERDLWLVAARSEVDVAGAYRELTGRALEPDRMRARHLAWALTDVADFVPALAAAPSEDADTVWQLEALGTTLATL